jgi:hypothetical protein
MTFFHDLNKRLAQLAEKQDLNESKVAESEKWIQKAVDPAHKGNLHKALHVAQGEKIPKAKIEKATHSKNPKLRHMAQFAKNVAKEGEEMADEGNAFTGALAKTPKGGKFKVGGKEFTDTSDLDEGFEEMDAWLAKREKEKGTGKFDKKERTLPGGMKATTYTRRHDDEEDTDDEVKSDAPKKKGRPKGKDKGPERTTKGAWKHKGERKVKADEALDSDSVMMTRPSNMSSESLDHDEYDAEGDMAKGDMHTIVRHAKELETHLRDNDNLPTWVIEKLGQIKGMMTSVSDYIMSEKERDIEHETGEEGIRIAEKITKKTPVGDVISDFVHSDDPKFAGKSKKQRINQALGAYYGMHKGKVKEESTDTRDNRAEKAGKKVTKDIEYDEKVDETTVAGSVATATTGSKSNKGGITFGKGVYESLNSKVESMITEGIKVESNMEECGEMGQSPSITIQADGDDAGKLLMLLKLAGLGGHELEENKVDWPTDELTLDADPELRTYSGGLNGPKSSGQTTIPVINKNPLRQNSKMDETVELERNLFKNWQHYKG